MKKLTASNIAWTDLCQLRNDLFGNLDKSHENLVSWRIVLAADERASALLQIIERK
jgi:hypothetical protein